MSVRLHFFSFVLCLLVLSAALPGPAQAASGTEGAAFLDIPVGAAPAAMGSAYSTLATDAYAPTWNPAGLGELNSTQIAGQHLSYLESIHYEYASIVHPFKPGKALGLSMQYLGTGDIDRTNIDASGNYVNPGGSFSSHYVSYNLAYGQKVTDHLSLGLTGKLIQAAIDDVTASAYAADVGSFYRVNRRLSFSGVVANLGSKLKFIDQADPLPLAVRAGAAYDAGSRWLLSGEVVYRKTGLTSAHAGAQWSPYDLLHLRLGYKTDALKELGPMAGLTVGMGIEVWGQELAYAWSPYGDLGSTHYFSMVLRFGGPAIEKRNLIRYHARNTSDTDRADAYGADPDMEYQQLTNILTYESKTTQVTQKVTDEYSDDR